MAADESAEKLERVSRCTSSRTVQDDAIALAAMLRALARSVRLAVVAGQDDDDIAALSDEIHAARAQEQRLLELAQETLRDEPASQRPTSPPPPGYDLAKDLAAPPTPQRLARITVKKITRF